MVAVADTKDGIAAVCNLVKRPRSIYLLYYLPPKNYGRRPKGGAMAHEPPPLNTLLNAILMYIIPIILVLCHIKLKGEPAVLWHGS
jgi:hypothetical protein